MRADSVRMQDRAIICDLEPVASLSSLASGNTNDEMVMEWPRCELGRQTQLCKHVTCHVATCHNTELRVHVTMGQCGY